MNCLFRMTKDEILELDRIKKEKRLHFVLVHPFVPSKKFKERVEQAAVLYNQLKKDLRARPLVDEIYVVYGGGKKDYIIRTLKSLIPKGIKIVFTKDIKVPDMKPLSEERGKGADVRRFGYKYFTEYYSGEPSKVVILCVDGDIRSRYYNNRFIKAGFYPFLIEVIEALVRFAKAVYARPKGAARVTKLVGNPLFSFYKDTKQLTDIAYLFSGEQAFRGDLLLDMPIAQRYGFETAALMHLNFDKKYRKSKVVTVNVGSFDHHHQGLSGLRMMSYGIQLVSYHFVKENALRKCKDPEVRRIIENFLGNFVKMKTKKNDNGHLVISGTLRYSEVNFKTKEEKDYEILYSEILYKPLSTIIPKVKT